MILIFKTFSRQHKNLISEINKKIQNQTTVSGKRKLATWLKISVQDTFLYGKS